MKKSLLQKILAVLARATIRRYKPTVIGVTGSVGKTSARLAAFAVIKGKYRAATAEKNYNNEIGLPLSILGIPHAGNNIFVWAYWLGISLWRLASPSVYRYPKVLVLEYGVDRPGDMDILVSIARPDIAIVTAIGDLPVHVEFFKSPTEVIAEKSKLVSALPATGCAILNHDDRAVYDMRAKTRARIMTFGRDGSADLKIANENPAVSLSGLTFKLEYKGSTVPVRLDGLLGIPQVYACSAGVALGLCMDMHLVEAVESLRGYTPPPGRMRVIEGIRGSHILDDTYNAAPPAMQVALHTLRDISAQRKIAVLGSMRELGQYTEDAHRRIGRIAVGCADMIFCVGEHAGHIADEAIAQGFSRAKIFAFPDSASAGRALRPLVEKGDLILVKGSQSMRMERIVEMLMAHPEKATELLVRQEPYWKNI